MEKSAERFKISQKFEASRQVLDKIGVQLFENLYFLKDILISFHMLFISWKNIAWFLSYGMLFILKFTIPGFPLK